MRSTGSGCAVQSVDAQYRLWVRSTGCGCAVQAEGCSLYCTPLAKTSGVPHPVLCILYTGFVVKNTFSHFQALSTK